MQRLTTVILAGIVLGSTAPAQEKKQKGRPKRRPNPAMAKVEDVPGLPRVLLIGDSISIGYTVPVRQMLQGAEPGRP